MKSYALLIVLQYKYKFCAKIIALCPLTTQIAYVALAVGGRVTVLRHVTKFHNRWKIPPGWAVCDRLVLPTPDS